jgi:hypothetical protein
MRAKIARLRNHGMLLFYNAGRIEDEVETMRSCFSAGLRAEQRFIVLGCDAANTLSARSLVCDSVTAAGANDRSTSRCESARRADACDRRACEVLRRARCRLRAATRSDLGRSRRARRPRRGDPRSTRGYDSAAAIFSAARVASAMIVICGLTPSEEGTAAPSTT